MNSENTPSLFPGEPPAVRLMNTIWASHGEIHDSLATTAMTRSWARAAEMPSTSRMNADQLARLRHVRDGLRRVAAHVTDDDRESAVQWDLGVEQAIEAVNAPFASSHPVLTRVDGTLEMTWHHDAGGFDGVVAELAIDGADLLTRSPDLRACHGPGCVLYYVKNHPRRGWCSSSCGNRARVARHYRRHRD